MTIETVSGASVRLWTLALNALLSNNLLEFLRLALIQLREEVIKELQRLKLPLTPENMQEYYKKLAETMQSPQCDHKSSDHDLQNYFLLVSYFQTISQSSRLKYGQKLSDQETIKLVKWVDSTRSIEYLFSSTNTKIETSTLPSRLAKQVTRFIDEEVEIVSDEPDKPIDKPYLTIISQKLEDISRNLEEKKKQFLIQCFPLFLGQIILFKQQAILALRNSLEMQNNVKRKVRPSYREVSALFKAAENNTTLKQHRNVITRLYGFFSGKQTDTVIVLQKLRKEELSSYEACRKMASGAYTTPT